MYAIRFDMHIVKKELTYMSPAEVSVTGIKIYNWQNLSLIGWLFPLEDLDLQGVKRQTRIWNSKVSNIVSQE